MRNTDLHNITLPTQFCEETSLLLIVKICVPYYRLEKLSA